MLLRTVILSFKVKISLNNLPIYFNWEYLNSVLVTLLLLLMVYLLLLGFEDLSRLMYALYVCLLALRCLPV